MATLVTALSAFLVFAFVMWRSLVPRAKERSKAMDEWHKNRGNYRWQDEVMPDDVPKLVKFYSSWLLIAVVIPAACWCTFLLLYKSGWIVRRDVIYFFWLPHLVCAVIVFIGLASFHLLENISEQKIRGNPFWKQWVLISHLDRKRKILGFIWLMSFAALKFEIGWVFIGGPVYLGVMK